ncbi:collagen-like protein [uncultured Methanobrevibacter sp.]|uniref:collagen-like protein n=1 Tax=uncultured Methanobrevibacter sp. TaxID=253161 RepID=UPI0025CE840A|nr:collagen-like protein [uncultured Methanobrevibacter sp.]
MSISLKNITAADTISSLVDKINYNFDQIVMNGGGIEGPKGDIGYPGMQGITGEQGAKGDQGNQGIRGSVWHLLNPTTEINENTRLDDPTDPDHKDPSGIPYQDNDMLLVLKMSDNSTSDKVIDSIWNVMYDENTNGYYPVNEQRIMTLDFFQQIPNADDNPNSIIRTAPSTNGRRGIVLNDYNGNINNISSTLVDDIIQHNIILIYTEAPEDAGEGSPNCGIVFYKNNSDDVLGDTGSDSGVGRMPRINYVVSQDERIKYLNICAPEQSLILKSKNDIKINSTEGVISCRINSNIQQNSNSTTRFELYKYDENTANKESYIEVNYNNDISELNLSGNNILLKNINANKNWIKIFDIPNVLSSCDILLENDNNCVDFDKILSVGKNGMYTPNPPTDPTDNYYNQARIVLNNDDNAVKEIVLIGSKITAGKLPNSMSYNDDTTDGGLNHNFNKFGMYIEKEHLSLCSTKKYNNNSLTHTYYSQIKLNAEANGRNNITLSTTYPGVIEMSNISGLYNSSIINYTDSTIDYSQKFIYAAPMGDKIISNNRYKYANCNFYKNLNIKNVNNIGAMYAGTTIFNGKYSDSSATVNDKLIYNFIRIGNVVHCTFSGVIDTSKICARTSDTPNIVLRPTNNYLADESYYKCNDSTYISEWTSSTYSQQYGSTTSATTIIGAGSINLATLNFIYLYLYPPIIRLTYKNNVYSTGVKNLIGHLTYSANGAIYEKSLSYNDNPTELSTNNNFIKIPHIKIFNMKNSVSNQFSVLNGGIGSANISTVNVAFDDFALNGTFTTKLVEIYGEFSYLLDIEYNPLLNHIHHKEDLFIPWIENDSSEGGEAPINSGSTTTNGDSGTTTNIGGNTNQEEENISSDINP